MVRSLTTSCCCCLFEPRRVSKWNQLQKNTKRSEALSLSGCCTQEFYKRINCVFIKPAAVFRTQSRSSRNCDTGAVCDVVLICMHVLINTCFLLEGFRTHEVMIILPVICSYVWQMKDELVTFLTTTAVSWVENKCLRAWRTWTHMYIRLEIIIKKNIYSNTRWSLGVRLLFSV